MRFGRRDREPAPSLNETQRALIKRKAELLERASFGFTQDRLLHLSPEEWKLWTTACTDELRQDIRRAAPAHVQIVLIEFRALRCLSLQCFSVGLVPAPVYA
jgi:hypothetical protein